MDWDCNSLVTKPFYIAPEVLKRQYDEKCDVWSCGVILFILLIGVPPFNGTTDKEIFEKVSSGKYNKSLPGWKYISSKAKKLISRMLELNPTKRCSAEEAAHDEWFEINQEEENHTLNPDLLKNIKKLNVGEFESQVQK